jgi:NAD(P)-dependent dehydrogenase (short-subunit alcohol dehydrogenase family)
MEIKGKGALVAGGASGLGAASVKVLHQAGASVLVCDVNDEAGQALARQLGGDTRFAQMDVTQEEAVQNAIDNVCDLSGEIQIVVNCAGILVGQKIVSKKGPHELSRFARVIEVNLVGTFNLLRLAAAAMQKNDPTDQGERGVIINTSSIAAFEGQIGQTAYAASKAGIVGLTLPAARELARDGIRVCSIAPGVFDTPMLGGLPDEIRDALGAQVPFPSRLGRPEEFAAMVKQIVENPMLNGETIRLDGALRMTAR